MVKRGFLTRYKRMNRTLTTFIPSSENNCVFNLSSMAFLLTESCQTNASVSGSLVLFPAPFLWYRFVLPVCQICIQKSLTKINSESHGQVP